jgi:hypothetical protein
VLPLIRRRLQQAQLPHSRKRKRLSSSHAITQPVYPAACTLKATGTVRHLEKNHHLWLFLYFYDDKYYAGDSLTLTKDGHWSGRIFIGGDKKPGQDFVLWLFDLGPNGWTELNTDIDGQNNGFHSWRLANDVSRIAYIDFRTGDEKCRT